MAEACFLDVEPGSALYVGIDLGTTGARSIVMDATGAVLATAKAAFASPQEGRAAPAWWQVVRESLVAALAQVGRERVCAISVSATSGTVLAVDAGGIALPQTYMYGDRCEDRGVLDRIAQAVPDWSPARGGTGGLACAILLQAQDPARIGHQADWINHHLTGEWVGDSSSALKTGYDTLAGCWPDWLEDAGLDRARLPQVFAVGSVMGHISRHAAADLGLNPGTQVIAGTTDGCASFLATGADRVGDGVTALGTTMTLKLLSNRPIFAPEFGVYSHKIGDVWLAGGASNSGGGAVLRHFTATQIEALSRQIDPTTATGLNYYPLIGTGERFPVADPQFVGNLDPRPLDPTRFLQGLFEGVAAVEAQAFAKLAELGAPPLTRLYSVGGGAQNPAWTALRAQRLAVPFATPRSTEAAYGSALLARKAAQT